MTEHQLYKTALETWGYDSQFDMLIEEMAELTQAILKSRRRSGMPTENLHEEFIDVKIVMSQIENCLNENRLEFWKQEKLMRLEKRLNEHKQGML